MKKQAAKEIVTYFHKL